MCDQTESPIPSDDAQGLASGNSASASAAGTGLPRVLVADDEASLRHLLGVILDRLGYPTVQAGDGEDALVQLAAHPDIRVVLCDVRMPRLSGLNFLRQVQQRDVFVVMMSAYASTDLAVEALRAGAYDFISKPFRAEEIRACLQRIVDHEQLAAENRRLQARVYDGEDLGGFVGHSPAARDVMAVIQRVAAYPSTVLLTGESGTGKELLAQALHNSSDRASGPLVAVNCAALPESLLESELFGHERGAFTGAVLMHQGLFEQADGGTLLLDEIGDMPLSLQTKLLRVLQDGRVRRVGSTRDTPVDVRVVAATARDLERDVEAGHFRKDLYYRLNVVHVRVPPLRKRVEDIPLLSQVLVQRVARRLGRRVEGISAQALRCLVACPWPGNVRQLENALERAVLMATEPIIQREDLPMELRAEQREPSGAVRALGDPGEPDDLSIKRHAAVLEQRLIKAALERTGGNRTQAARLLDIAYKTLVYKIRDYGLDSR